MVVNVQDKLRIAIGSVKDHASIGKAMIYNREGLAGIEIAVVRATGHDNTPIDDQHMHEILFLVSNSPGSVPYLAERISHRLDKTRDRVVALKTLVLVHRLLRGGNRNFEHDLRNAHLSGYLQMNTTRWFPMNSDHSISFLHNYAAFLEERIGWVINQAGKLEPVMTQDKSMELAFHKLPKCQVFLDKVLNCSPLEVSPSDCLTLVAIRNILRESFQVYVSFREGLATLVDSFFDCKQPARASTLELLKKASRQSYELLDFFKTCKRTIGIKNLDYPSVQIITMDHVSAMEQFLNCSPPSTNNSSLIKRGTSPCPIYSDHKRPSETQANLRGNIGEKTTTSTSSPFFPCRLETIISTIWVVFDEDESESSSFSVSTRLENCSPTKGNVTECMEIQEELPSSYYNPFTACVEIQHGNFKRG